jgi:hypothetical protein
MNAHTWKRSVTEMKAIYTVRRTGEYLAFVSDLNGLTVSG